jgi:hypothetical protein
VAVQVTFVPDAEVAVKLEPEAGVQTTDGANPELSVAVGLIHVRATDVAPLGIVAWMGDGHDDVHEGGATSKGIK